VCVCVCVDGGGDEIINRDGEALDVCIYYVEKHHKRALREADKQAARDAALGQPATNLRVVASETSPRKKDT